jgi:GAF domain-containing protein
VYGSLVSVPIEVGDEVVGVFNVISSRERAFRRGDITYIEILGSMIDVAWGLRTLAIDDTSGQQKPIDGD